METLLLAAIGTSVALAFGLYRQRRVVTALGLKIKSQDETIRQLQSEANANERELCESGARYSTAANAAFDIIFLLDEDLKVLMANQSAERLFAAGSPIGRLVTDIISSPDLLNFLQLALREEESLEDHFVVEGRNYRARVQSAPSGQSGRCIGIGMQDITDLVNLNRARRDLVANISHELRTPITRIRLIIESLFLDADRPKRKASIQSLKEIAMETDALLWLAQELLDLSMIESGEAILRLVKTPLTRVVEDAIERLEAQAAMKDLKIVSHVAPEYHVLCDADQLKRVMGNLIHNAIKWSPAGETITITASEQEDEITVSIFDNGPGVPDDICARVFERFYQADVSRSGDEGAGLGLAICKHIIEAHGGRIWAEGNSLGNGGHFLFTVLKADTRLEENAIANEDDYAPAAVSESPSPL